MTAISPAITLTLKGWRARSDIGIRSTMCSESADTISTPRASGAVFGSNARSCSMETIRVEADCIRIRTDYSRVLEGSVATLPFNRALCNRGLFTIFSDALHYDVPAHASSWLASRTNEPHRRNFGQYPQVLSGPDLSTVRQHG